MIIQENNEGNNSCKLLACFVPTGLKINFLNNIYTTIVTEEQIQCIFDDILSFFHSFLHIKTYEPCREKTNVLVSDQVTHKPGCTATEDG